MSEWVDDYWMQAGLDALRETLAVDAHTRRRMIEFLFDTGLWDATRLTWQGAEARWNACLNPAKPEFFKMAEQWALMRRFGRHHLALAMIKDLGYETPRLRSTPARREEVLERLAVAEEEHAAALRALRAELQRIDPPDPDLRLHSAISGKPGAKFSMGGF